MRSARLVVFVLAQASLLFGAEGQRRITGDGSIRESTTDGREAPTELVSGSSVNFTLPSITRPTLFTGDFGYRVRVPQGATELRLRLITNSDIELYARFEADPQISSSGTVVADHSTELNNAKDLRIGLSGSPGLRAGTYHIALAAFDQSAPNTGTIQVTITNPNPPPTPTNLNVAIGAENNIDCPTSKRISVAVSDPAGSLAAVSGLTASNFTVLEGTAVKSHTLVSCPTVLQCILAYPPTDATRAADVEVRVNVNGRTGSARTTVTACTAAGGGGTAPGRTATSLKVEMGSVTSANVFQFGGHVWSTGNDSAFTLGVTRADSTAPLLNAANRSINIPLGSYFLHAEPGGMLSHARLTVVWSDGGTEEAVFATTPVTTSTAWTRVSGSTGLSMSSTGLVNLNKIGPGTGVGPGGGADFVWRLDLGTGTGGGGGIPGRTATSLKLEMGSVTSANVFQYGGHVWSTGNDSAFTLGVTRADPSAPLLNAANRSINIPLGSYFLHGEPGGMLSHARLTVVWSDGVTEEAVFATTPVTTSTAWTRVSGSTGLSMSSTGLVNLNKIGPGTGVGPGGGADFVWRLDLGTGTGSGGGGIGTGCPSTTNIALTGTATQSSTAFGGPANLGNNGVIAEPNGYGQHTDLQANPWWQVDFGSTKTICEVRLYNRSDGYYNRARTVRVLISTNGTDFEAVYSHNGTSWGETGAPLTVPVSSRSARYVRIQLTETEYLHMREIQVFGSDGAGGSGSGSGGLTVTVGAEDNAACPLTKRLVVSVVDSAGSAVTGLAASNFALTENGVGRTVNVTCRTSSSGTSAGSGAVVAIVIDTSGSLNSSDLVNEKAAAVNLVNSLGANDQVAVYNFDSTVTRRQAFTTNKQLAITAINSLSIGGSTALYQALHLAATDIAAVTGRKAIVLMTDGSDNQGGKTIDEAIAAAKAASAPVYAVGFGSGINEAVMRRMGTETGGTFTRGATSAELQALLQTVALNITSTCEVSYSPANAAVPADVVVTVTQGTRTGSGARRVAACASSGGGGGAGGFTVTVGAEDNTACPVTKRLVVSVVDSAGSAVTGLAASNFALTENGVGRTVNVTCSSSSSGTSAGSGAVVAIVIDTSGSLSSADLVNEKAAAVNLVNSLGANDQVAVYNFDSTVTRRQAFTTNKQLAITAINSLSNGGSTALYQALHLAATDIAAVTGRKAIVLMTDGSDNQGGKTIDEAIAAAKAAGAPVYAVGFGSGINEAVMRRMGTETGGTFTRGATSAELQALLQTVALNITSTCEVSYSPANAAVPADVVVTVTQGTRTGSGARRVAACVSSSGGGGVGGITTGPGWAVTQGCNYFVTPLAATPPAAQSTGIIRVTTLDNCEWSGHSEVSWVRVTAVRNANGRGSGALDYLVSANPDPFTRTGRVITAGQIHTITQAAGTACSVTISPTTARVGPGAGTSTVLVNATTATCAWTARSNDAWLRLSTSTVTGTGNGRISYSWDTNATTSSRTATMTVNGQTFTLTQDAGSIPGTPTVTETGIVNSASGIPPSLPGGALAQGSFFTIFASGVGPAPPQQVEQFPLPTTLGGTLVQIRQGSRTVDCYLVYTSNTQINGIIPSNAPLGDAEMIVTFNGRASRPAAVRIARNNFGIFATSQGRGPGIIQNFQTQLEQPLNTRAATAKPRQVIILWGTGAGPISAPDNVAPPAGNLPFPFEMTIGGRPATLLYNGRAPCCSGVDQIVAEVPADAPSGCFVPVQVKAGDVWSNVVTMAIDPAGNTCNDPTNPASTVTSKGGKIGVVALTRLSASLNVAGQGQQNLDADIGIASFPQMTAGGDLGFNMLTSMPPSGTCQAYAGVRDISDLLGGAFGGPVQTAGGTTFLDGGAAIRVAGPGGASATLDKSTNGTYMGILSGSLPLPGSTASMPLNPGTFTVTGSGGRDVGAFSSSLTLRPGLTWTNRASINSIDRKTPFSVSWTGGTAGEQVLIVGYGTDQKVKASSGFLCSAPAGSGSFTIPAAVMGNLPAVPASGDLSEKFGLLGIVSFRSTGMASPFQAPGLDIGLLLGAQVDLKSVEIK
jgi:uncharacterized protein (TIGR03437 family)